MHPAFSVISFTTLLGAAQGLIVTLGILRLLGYEVNHLAGNLAIGAVLLVISLGASFVHLGHPERAWRAAMMWRTSWLSREVIVLPIFIGLTVLWAFVESTGVSQAQPPGVLSGLVISILMVSLGLWICTAMIYACIRFIQEWSHPITLVNYTLLGLASGLTLSCLLFVINPQDPTLIRSVGYWAIGVTLLSGLTRWISVKRNAKLSPRSTLQSAIGIRNPTIVQKSMGMSAGAFNTREFFHQRGVFFVSNVKRIMLVFGFILPVALLATGLYWESPVLIALGFPIQYLGMLSERWLFFAQARHPQNLYYQTVS
jgi:DMSO reductase anchor subunit